MKIRLQVLILTISSLLILTAQGFSFDGHLAKERNRFSRSKENQNPEISYSIEPFYDINAFRLIVVLKFQGEKSGTTKIILPNFRTDNAKKSGVKFLKALSPNIFIADTDNP